MIVSFSRRFIFVHLAKTGGESVTRALLPALDSDDIVLCRPVAWRPGRLGEAGVRETGLSKHSRLPHVRDALQPLADGFLSFGFVRNPWDRVVSYFEYLGHRDFGAHVASGPPVIGGFHGSRGLDVVGRFETLTADFEAVCVELGIDAHLEATNPSARGPYRSYYDDTTRQVVADRFRDDIDTFGYEF